MLTGTAGGRTVFQVSLSDDGTGQFRFVLLDQLDHAANGNENDIALTFNYTATDSDGDAVSSKFVVSVDDDVPTIASNAVVYTDDETSSAPDDAPNFGGTGDYTGSPPANLTGTLAHAYGADGAGTTLLLATNPTPGFNYTLSPDGKTLTISQMQDLVSVDVMRVTLTDTTSGAYTVEQLNEIDHSAPGASEENLLLNVNYRVTDGDGDTVDGALTINADDDTPTVVADDICESVPAGPGDVANFVLVLDTSGSIESGQLSLIQDAVENLLNQIGSSGAQNVRIHIVEFGSTATSVGTYDIVSGGTLNATALANAIADVNALNSGGSTNYEAGLQQALPFIQGIPSQTINVTSADSHDANSLNNNNDTAYIVGNGSTQIALVSGWTSPGTANDQLVDVNNDTGGVSDGWGVQGGSSSEDVNTAEMLRFDFGSFNNFGVANYNSGGFAGVNVQSATFTLDDNNDNGNTNFGYTIHFVGGATESGSSNVNGNASVTLTGTGGNAGALIDYIEFTVTGSNSSGDIDLQSVVTAGVAPGALPNADVNSLIFISDGEPNAANDSNGNPVGVNAQDAINQILGEVGQVEGNGGGLDQAFTIEAFHIGSPTTTINVTSADFV